MLSNGTGSSPAEVQNSTFSFGASTGNRSCVPRVPDTSASTSPMAAAKIVHVVAQGHMVAVAEIGALGGRPATRLR